MAEFIFVNGRTIMLVVFFLAFLGILIYLFGNRRRGQRLESYRDIPLQDDEPDTPRVKHDE